MKSIPFFLDTIVIVPHTATDAALIGKPISLRDFIGEQRASLYETGTGDLQCVLGDFHESSFIEGPEADQEGV